MEQGLMPMAFDTAPAETVAVALDPRPDDQGYCYGHDDRDDGIRDDLSCYLSHRQAVACNRISFLMFPAYSDCNADLHPCGYDHTWVDISGIDW